MPLLDLNKIELRHKKRYFMNTDRLDNGVVELSISHEKIDGFMDYADMKQKLIAEKKINSPEKCQNLSTTELLEIFKQTIFYDEMVNDQNITLIVLGGSRGLSLSQGKNDVDLILYSLNLKNTQSWENKYWIMPNGVNVHTIIHPISKWYEQSDFFATSFYLTCPVGNKINNIIWSKNEDDIKSLLKISNIYKAFFTGITNFINNFANKKYWNFIITKHDILPEFASKYFYRLYITSRILTRNIDVQKYTEVYNFCKKWVVEPNLINDPQYEELKLLLVQAICTVDHAYNTNFEIMLKN